MFSHIPTELAATRAAIAAELGGPAASKGVHPSAVAPVQQLTYTLAYSHAGADATLVVTDQVPAGTPVTGADGPGTVEVLGQSVSWKVAVAAGDTVTLTIGATAGSVIGPVTNTAVFSSTVVMQGEARVLIYSESLFMPSILRNAVP